MPSRHKGPRHEVQALEAYVKLLRAAETVAERAGEQVAAFGLTTGQFAVLEALFHLGSMNSTQLARKLLRSGANTTTVLDHLEKRSLVKRTRGERDRRCVAVHLTAEGRDLIRRVFPMHASMVTGLMSVLKPVEQELLASLCKKLGLGLCRQHPPEEPHSKPVRHRIL